MYSSVTKPHSRRKKKKKVEISQLAQDSFEAFQPFINVFDCGTTYGNGPFHLITKESWQFFARWKKGERNICRADGFKFNPYLDVVRNVYSPAHVQKHMKDHQITYYTSGQKGLGLLYLDVDAHHDWQTDQYRAKQVLERLFPAYFRASNRGQNGYLKVRYGSIQEFNAMSRRLEGTLKRLFLHLNILCDIEVKGTITHNGTSGQLAKLPFQCKYPCNMRDETDSWNYPQLKRFKASPILNVRRVEHVARRIEGVIDENRVEEGRKVISAHHQNETKQRLHPNEREIPKPAKRQTPNRPTIPTTEPPSTNNTRSPSHLRRPASLDPCQSTDAFERNLSDIPPFIRTFYREYHRFPSTNETLHWLRENGLYSGQWEDNERQRSQRVRQILQFKKKTFDPTKLSSGDSQQMFLRLGRLSWWVRRHFGNEMTVRVTDPSKFDPVKMTAPTKTVSIPAKFIETFLAVVDACVNQSPLKNKAVPTNRIKVLWKMVLGGSAWNQKYYQLVRDKLDRMGVLRIFDREHQSGKAWCWEAGRDFPQGSFKEHEQQRKRSVTGTEEGTYSIKNNKVYNTLYHIPDEFVVVPTPNPRVRPPP